jgi:capsule polysaccharide export protein KpsE/RkpR
MFNQPSYKFNHITALVENMMSDKWKNQSLNDGIFVSVVSKTQHLGKIIGITNVLRHSAFVRYWRQQVHVMSQYTGL